MLLLLFARQKLPQKICFPWFPSSEHPSQLQYVFVNRGEKIQSRIFQTDRICVTDKKFEVRRALFSAKEAFYGLPEFMVKCRIVGELE